MMKWMFGICLAGLVAAPGAFALDAADPGAGPESSLARALPATPLGVRQARVERMMRELERKFTALAAALEETEKEQADRLTGTISSFKLSNAASPALQAPQDRLPRTSETF